MTAVLIILGGWTVISCITGVGFSTSEWDQIKKEGGFFAVWTGMLFDKEEWGDVKNEPYLLLATLLLLPFIAFVFCLIGVYYGVKSPLLLYRYFTRGELGMKRKLVLFVLTLVLGYESPKILEYGEVFYHNLKNPQVGPEATKLVASLESGQGWHVTNATLHKTGVGNLYVKTGYLLPNIWILDMPVDNQYSYTDRIAINRAAAKCLRQMAAKAVEDRDTVVAKVEE